MYTNLMKFSEHVDQNYNGVVSGNMSTEGADELLKAMSIGDQQGAQTWNATDQSAAPLKVESLEGTMKVLTAQPKHYPIFAKLSKKPVFNNIHEYLQLVSYGTPDYGFVSEGELPEVEDTIYRRKPIQIKYSGIVGGVTFQAELVKTGGGITSMLAQEATNKARLMAMRMEYHLPFADSRVVPEQYNGIFSQLETESEYPSFNAYMNSPHVIDARGSILKDYHLADATQVIRDYFGFADTIISHPAVFTNYNKQWLDKKLIHPTSPHVNAPIFGQTVRTIATQNGPVEIMDSNFFRLGGTQTKNSLSGPTTSKAPAAPALVTSSSVASPNSKFVGTDTYYYAVAAKNNYGESALTFVTAASVVAPVATAPGFATDLVLTPGTTSQYAATGWAVYRSKANATSSNLADIPMYKIFEVGMTQWTNEGYDTAGTAVAAQHILDNDRIISGTDQALVIEWASDQVFSFLQLGQMMKMDLALTAPIRRFMIMLFGTPVIYAPKKVVRIVNIGDRV